MSSFEIVTADRPMWNIDKIQVVIDHAQSACGPDASPQEIDAAVVRMIHASIGTPKRAETVRAHFIQYWPLIAPMAARSPASFDFIILEFAERISDLG